MSFDVRIAADISGPITAWRDRFLSSVGEAKYRRAAGWTVDEVAKTAVVGIRAQFHKTLDVRNRGRSVRLVGAVAPMGMVDVRN
ncbi:hypothetical protein ACFZ8E_22815 [Methylobacterium sp. HMF5984]|uniref:hypothetical protein n=1 Tax=Methylobacterium sp. HMF5984 TaxID=3367370 RepID=UPI003851B13B